MKPWQSTWLLLLLAILALPSCQSNGANPQDRPLLFFPPPPAASRVQFLTSFQGSKDVVEARSSFELFALGGDPDAPKAIEKPYGVAARDGVVYVCDTRKLNLTRVDFKKRTFTVLGTEGPGRLLKPINVVLDSLGYKFVVDPVRKQIVVFDPDDRFAAAYDVPPPCRPVDLALFENEIYVLDNDKTCQIVVMERKTGKVLRTFGGPGTEPGQFHYASSLCIDAEGFVYVSDTLNFRIQKLTREGKPVWVRGGAGHYLEQFGRPRGIRAGPDGRVFVVDAAMQLVKLYEASGTLRMRFGGPGNTPGGMVLPASVAIDRSSLPFFRKYIHRDFRAEYLIFVANQFGSHLVSVYAFGSFPEGYRLREHEIAELPSPSRPAPSSPPPATPEEAPKGETTPRQDTGPPHLAPGGKDGRVDEGGGDHNKQ